MLDEVKVGKTSCQFWPEDTFWGEVKHWIEGARLIHVVTLNPEMVMLAEQDEAFRRAINDAEVRVPDGAGLVWARWYVRSRFWSLLPSLLAFPFVDAERITGVDMVKRLAQICAEAGRTMYLMGGTDLQVNRTAQLLREENLRLEVHTARNHAYEADGPADVLEDVKKKQPAVLLAAYGAPKQSLWIERNRQHLSEAGVRVAAGVGGAFAILSEDKPRAPRALRRLNAEWLWRLWLEPARMKRIWQAVVKFPLLVHQYKKANSPRI